MAFSPAPASGNQKTGGRKMLFVYLGYTVYRMGDGLYWIIGQGFNGYETTPEAARRAIDGVIAGQCAE
jgi:hypothetical protein